MTAVYAFVIVLAPASFLTVTCPTLPVLSGNNVIVVLPFTSTLPEKAVP